MGTGCLGNKKQAAVLKPPMLEQVCNHIKTKAKKRYFH